SIAYIEGLTGVQSHLSSTDPNSTSADSGTMDGLEALEGADLRQLDSFLKTSDEGRVLGNLYRTVTSKGHIKWVCLDHYRENYRSKAAQELRDAVQEVYGEYNEVIGSVTVELSSSIAARRLYSVLSSSRSVQQLDISFGWSPSRQDLRDLRDAIKMTTIFHVRLNGAFQDAPLSDLLNTNRRSDPILQMMSSSNIRSFYLDAWEGFLDRISKVPASLSVRSLRIQSDEKWSKRVSRAVSILQACPSLSELVLRVDSVEMVLDPIVAALEDGKRSQPTKLTMESKHSKASVEFEAHTGQPSSIDLSGPDVIRTDTFYHPSVRNLNLTGEYDLKTLLDLFSRLLKTNTRLESVQIDCSLENFGTWMTAFRELFARFPQQTPRFCLWYGFGSASTSNIQDPTATKVYLKDIDIKQLAAGFLGTIPDSYSFTAKELQMGVGTTPSDVEALVQFCKRRSEQHLFATLCLFLEERSDPTIFPALLKALQECTALQDIDFQFYFIDIDTSNLFASPSSQGSVKRIRNDISEPHRIDTDHNSADTSRDLIATTSPLSPNRLRQVCFSDTMLTEEQWMQLIQSIDLLTLEKVTVTRCSDFTEACLTALVSRCITIAADVLASRQPPTAPLDAWVLRDLQARELQHFCIGIYETAVNDEHIERETERLKAHSGPDGEMFDIEVSLDPDTNQQVVYWSAITFVFLNTRFIKKKNTIVTFVRNAQREWCEPRRIRHYPGVVLEVVEGGNSLPSPVFEATHTAIPTTSVVPETATASPASLSVAVSSSIMETVFISASPASRRLLQRTQSMLQETSAQLGRYGRSIQARHVVQADIIKQGIQAMLDIRGGMLALRSEVAKNNELKELRQQILDFQSAADMQARRMEEIYKESLHEYSIPRLFIVLPKEDTTMTETLTRGIKNVFAEQFKLYFLCECGDHTKPSDGRPTNPNLKHEIHIVRHEGYDIDRPTEFFYKYGPYVLTLLQMFKYGVAIAGVLVPPVGQFKLVDSVKDVHEGINHILKDIGPRVDSSIAYIEGLTGLDSLLKISEEGRVLGSLYRIVTSEGHVKWVCLDHYRENYHAKVAHELRDSVQEVGGEYNEVTESVTIKLSSSIAARRLYSVLSSSRSVQQLDISFGWSPSRQDLRDLRDAIKMTTIFHVRLNGAFQDAPLSDLLNTNRRSDPILQMMSSSNIRSFYLDAWEGFLDRISKVPASLSVRSLRIQSDEKWSKRVSRAVSILQACPSLSELVLRVDSVEMVLDPIVAALEDGKRSQPTKLTMETWNSKASVSQEQYCKLGSGHLQVLQHLRKLVDKKSASSQGPPESLHGGVEEHVAI
ncbi:hypothetical protein BGX29_002192, partial [Mortierella sp. GBA35]